MEARELNQTKGGLSDSNNITIIVNKREGFPSISEANKQDNLENIKTSRYSSLVVWESVTRECLWPSKNANKRRGIRKIIRVAHFTVSCKARWLKEKK